LGCWYFVPLNEARTKNERKNSKHKTRSHAQLNSFENHRAGRFRKLF